MEPSWQYWLFVSALYLIGGIGFAGITLLPLRAWLLLRRYSRLLSAPIIGKAAYALIALVAAVTVVFSGVLLFKVAQCLLGLPCHPNRAGGWFFLASIGVWYLVFEVFSFTILRVARRFVRDAA